MYAGAHIQVRTAGTENAAQYWTSLGSQKSADITGLRIDITPVNHVRGSVTLQKRKYYPFIERSSF